MQIDSMSVRLGIRDLLDPALEERPRVMWARPGLGVELERARAQVWEIEAFDGSVVEGDVGRLGCFARPDCKPVVLARDEDATRMALEHRMVRAAVAERELVGLVAGRAGDELVAEADAEHRRPAEQLLHRLRLGSE